MVKIINYSFTKTMSSRKYRNIRNRPQYLDKTKKGLFEYLKAKEQRLKNKNFIIKYFNNYNNLRYFLKYRTYKDIEVKYYMPFTEGLARHLVDTARRQGRI